MNKSQINALLKPQIKVLRDSIVGASKCNWDRNRALYTMREMINWNISPYGSFRTFYNQLGIVDLGYHSAMAHLTDYSAVLQIGFNTKDIDLIATKLSYTRAIKFARFYLNEMKASRKRRIKASEFIKQALASTITTNGFMVTNGVTPNQITLCLSDSQMHKLELALAPHGFVKTTNGMRMNISKAFGSWLDTL